MTSRRAPWLLTVALAGLTVVLLAGTVVSAAWAWRASGVGPVVGPVVGGEGVAVRLPSGWVPLAADERVFYADEQGDPVAEVDHAAVLDPGACGGDPASHRGFVGLAPARGGPLDAVHRAAERAWTAGLAAGAGQVEVVHREVVGTARRTDLLVRVDEPDGCVPPLVRASLLTTREAAGPRTVVLVRDAGVPGAMSESEADLVLEEVGGS